MVKMLASMLGGAPELERELLPALVNKLGDPEKKVASRLTHLLHTLLHQHPAMKPVLLAEVQRFVLRPRMAERALCGARARTAPRSSRTSPHARRTPPSPRPPRPRRPVRRATPPLGVRARYYACTFLNQLVLSRREPEVAQQLLRIYLALFASRTQEDQPLDTRMLSCLLSGIHRAVPYCTGDAPGELLLGQLHSLFRCAHSPNLSTAVQALMVLGHASQFDSATEDRWATRKLTALPPKTSSVAAHPRLVGQSPMASGISIISFCFSPPGSTARCTTRRSTRTSPSRRSRRCCSMCSSRP